MYVEDPGPLVAALARWRHRPAWCRSWRRTPTCSPPVPAQEGRWSDALAAFDADRQVNGLGIDTRADRVDDLSALLADNGVDPIAWYGVRLFTDSLAARPSGRRTPRRMCSPSSSRPAGAIPTAG